MKLKLLPPLPPQKITPQPKVDKGFGNPIGWWKVTTEGDCEGRTTKQCGEFYGHVAEIALFLGNQGGYKLQFEPILGRKAGKRQTLQATVKAVWISLGIASETWNMTHDKRATWMAQWLDAAEDIEVKPTDGHAHYFAGAYIKLK